jgi:photosystem II stability/assembly factor-like uncharacterized protein
VFSVTGVSQEPTSPVLENTGKPIAVPAACSEDDLRWAGCTPDEPCPLFLELAAAGSGGGDRIFAAGNLHSSSVTVNSLLLASDDGGHTWREAHRRIRGAALDRLQFADAESGWCSGQTLSPAAQDPFFLATTDGGRTWRRQPVFSDTHPGFIQQFLFTSRRDGALILDTTLRNEDRYERYESQDGGASWAIRQTSRTPLVLKDATEASDWRVRTDAGSQSYVVERRTGETWSRIAAFAIKLGECKPPAVGDDGSKQ